MDKSFALIVESDRNIADLFQQALGTAGFQSEVVFNAPQVLERLSNRQPWLVILDLDLPGISGNTLIQTIRKDERLRQMKVIAVTSYSQVAEGLAVEPDLLLFKPVGIEQFSDLLERFQLKIKFQTTVPMTGEPWDRVTGVYNQSFFLKLLEGSLLRARETKRYSFAVLAVSFDHNNSVKKQLEIKNWITALRVAAETLSTTVRPTDTVARFDQDKFYILIEDLPSWEIPRMVASRIYRNLNQRLTGLGYKVHFPISIGTLICDHGYENVDMVLADAEHAQVLATAQGMNIRNSGVRFPPKNNRGVN